MGRNRTKPGRWDVDINYTVLVHVQTVAETDCYRLLQLCADNLSKQVPKFFTSQSFIGEGVQEILSLIGSWLLCNVTKIKLLVHLSKQYIHHHCGNASQQHDPQGS